MANRIPAVRESEGEKQRKSLHHRLPERGIKSLRAATRSATSIINLYGVYHPL